MAKRKLQNKPAEAPARDALGRLLPGHTANPGGRPKAATLAMAALEDQTGALMKAAIERALKGNNMLLMFLLPYKLGRPAQKIELTGSDGEPIRISAVREQLADRLSRLLVPGKPE